MKELAFFDNSCNFAIMKKTNIAKKRGAPMLMAHLSF